MQNFKLYIVQGFVHTDLFRLQWEQSTEIYKLSRDMTNQQCGYAPSEDSDQPGHQQCGYARTAKTQISLGIPQRRLWSDWADAQADLSLRWAHSHFVGFVMLQLSF